MMKYFFVFTSARKDKKILKNDPLMPRGGIHSQEIIETKWSRLRNPGFLAKFFYTYS
jgi:hypothetical protein